MITHITATTLQLSEDAGILIECAVKDCVKVLNQRFGTAWAEQQPWYFVGSGTSSHARI